MPAPRKKQNPFIRTFRILGIMMQRTRTPHRLALGFALGLSLSIIPIPTAGMFAALALAGVFRLNLITTYLGTFIVNPLTGIFFLILDYRVGTWILQTPVLVQINRENAVAVLAQHMKEIAVGSVVCAAVFGVLSYAIIYFGVRLFRKQRSIPVR